MAHWLMQADTQGTTIDPDPIAGSVKAMIVRAADEEGARNVARENAGTEGDHVWNDPAQSTCHPLDPEGGDYVVFRAFNE